MYASVCMNTSTLRMCTVHFSKETVVEQREPSEFVTQSIAVMVEQEERKYFGH